MNDKKVLLTWVSTYEKPDMADVEIYIATEVQISKIHDMLQQNLNGHDLACCFDDMIEELEKNRGTPTHWCIINSYYRASGTKHDFGAIMKLSDPRTTFVEMKKEDENE